MKNWKLDYQYLKTPCLSWLRVIYTVVDVLNRYVKEICHIYSYVFVSNSDKTTFPAFCGEDKTPFRWYGQCRGKVYCILHACCTTSDARII